MTKEQTFKALKGIRYIVINTDYGGFGLSAEAESRYKSMAGITDENWWYMNIERDDPYLIQIVHEMGEEANGRFANLKIVEVPEDVDWEIAEYDGREWITEKHRTWS